MCPDSVILKGPTMGFSDTHVLVEGLFQHAGIKALLSSKPQPNPWVIVAISHGNCSFSYYFLGVCSVEARGDKGRCLRVLAQITFYPYCRR